MRLSWFFVILLLVFVAVFSVQNAAPITVHFLAWEITMSGALVIQLAALLGGLVGLTVGVRARRTRRRHDEAAGTASLVTPEAQLPPKATPHSI